MRFRIGALLGSLSLHGFLRVGGFCLCMMVCVLGCSKTIVIESTTTWDAAVSTHTLSELDARTIHGSHNAHITSDGSTVCWLVQKGTADGTLRVYVLEQSLVGADRVGDQLTSDAFGIVAGCSSQ